MSEAEDVGASGAVAPPSTAALSNPPIVDRRSRLPNRVKSKDVSSGVPQRITEEDSSAPDPDV